MPHTQTGQAGKAGLLQCPKILLTCLRAKISANRDKNEDEEEEEEEEEEDLEKDKAASTVTSEQRSLL